MYDVDGGSKTCCCCLDDDSDEGEEDIDNSLDIAAADWWHPPCSCCNNALNIWARPPGRKRLQGHQENFFTATKDILLHFPDYLDRARSPTKEVSTRPGPVPAV